MVSPGLQDWSPVPEGNSEQGLDTGAQVLTRLWAGGPANLERFYRKIKGRAAGVGGGVKK